MFHKQHQTFVNLTNTAVEASTVHPLPTLFRLLGLELFKKVNLSPGNLLSLHCSVCLLSWVLVTQLHNKSPISLCQIFFIFYFYLHWICMIKFKTVCLLSSDSILVMTILVRSSRKFLGALLGVLIFPNKNVCEKLRNQRITFLREKTN